MNPRTEDIWHHLGDAVGRFIRSRVGDAALAEDLRQEVFLRIHRAIDGLRDDSRLESWVFSIARNAITDHHRRNGSASATTLEPGQATTDPDRRAGEPGADETAQRIGGWLRDMIGHLPQPYREAMELAELEGFTQVAIAERLGLSHSGAKSRIQRGRALLKQQLLRCCHIEFDRRGNAVAWQRHGECDVCCKQASGPPSPCETPPVPPPSEGARARAPVPPPSEGGG